MPRVLGFKKVFAERVRLGLKRQTVRAPSAMLPVAGEQRMFYSGLRTRHCRPIFPEAVTIEEVQPITLWFAKPYFLTAVELGCPSNPCDPELFAVADGFAHLAMRAKGAWTVNRKAYWVGEHPGDTAADVFGCWFRHAHPKQFEAGVFEGWLLRWAPPVLATSEAEYRETFGQPIDPVMFKHYAEFRGWRDDDALPTDMPDDLRQALGER